MKLYPRLYVCVKCGRNTTFWVSNPTPDKLHLVGGGCTHCTTPQPLFIKWKIRDD